MNLPKPRIFFADGCWRAVYCRPERHADRKTNQTLCAINKLAIAFADGLNRKYHHQYRPRPFISGRTYSEPIPEWAKEFSP